MVNQSRPFRLHRACAGVLCPAGNRTARQRDGPRETGGKAGLDDTFRRVARPGSTATKNPASAGSLIHSSPEWWAVQGSNL